MQSPNWFVQIPDMFVRSAESSLWLLRVYGLYSRCVDLSSFYYL